MGKSNVVATSSLFQLLLLLFLHTLKYVHAGFICYGDFLTVKYGINRDKIFSSLASNVVTNGGFYNVSSGKDSENSRVHVVALCRRGYENQACQKCLEHVIEDTKSNCRQKESFAWVTYESNDVSCNIRYTNHSTFGKLELSPFTINPNPNNINSPNPKNMTIFGQEWNAMVNRTLEAASTAETSSVLKYYNATRTEFTEILDVYALMQCTPDISPGDCKRCLRECVTEFQKQFWERQGGGVGRPSCYFRWDLFPFYKAFDNVSRVLAPPAPRPPQSSPTTLDCGKDKNRMEGKNIAIIVVPGIINFLIFAGLMCSWKRKRTHTVVKGI